MNAIIVALIIIGSQGDYPRWVCGPSGAGTMPTCYQVDETGERL